MIGRPALGVVAVVLLLVPAVLLVLDVGARSLWIAVIATGVGVVALGAGRRRRQGP